MTASDADPTAHAILTLAEVATILRLSKATVSKLSRGRVRGVKPLPAFRVGRRVLVHRDAFFEWLSTQSSGSVVR